MTTERKPLLTLAIGGEEYRFAAIEREQVDRLQAGLKARASHPLDVLKDPKIDELTRGQQDKLFDRAIARMDSWPPRLDTAMQQLSLLATVPGQIDLLHEALLVYRPETTRDDAERVYAQLDAEFGEQAAAAHKEGRELSPNALPLARICAAAFGRTYL